MVREERGSLVDHCNDLGFFSECDGEPLLVKVLKREGCALTYLEKNQWGRDDIREEAERLLKRAL